MSTRAQTKAEKYSYFATEKLGAAFGRNQKEIAFIL
jgi:hypothetical protein